MPPGVLSTTPLEPVMSPDYLFARFRARLDPPSSTYPHPPLTATPSLSPAQDEIVAITCGMQ
jgi:hypothetical protein